MTAAAALRAEIEDLTQSILLQRAVLRDMLQRRKNLKTQLDSVTYPVLTLPPEITSEIFVHCMPHKPVDFREFQPPPLVLMHVCKAWRQLSVQTPALWAHFVVDVDDRRAQWSEILSLILERSRQRPLNVLFRHSAEESPKACFDSHMEDFQQYSHRVQSLELRMSRMQIKSMDPFALALSALEKLVIRFVWDDSHSALDPDFHIQTFAHCDLLHEFDLYGLFPSEIALPWQQITQFTAQRTVCLGILPQMLKLESFHLHYAAGEGDISVIHPAIQDLSLYEWMLHLSILNNLTLPYLETFKFQGRQSHPKDSQTLEAFLERSSPPLKRLSVNFGEGGTGLDISGHLAALSLTHLEIYSPQHAFLCRFFDAFGTDPTFLPQLQHLSLRECRAVYFQSTLGEVLELASSPITQRMAMEGCARLRSLHFVAAENCDVTDIPELYLRPYRDFQGNGVDVHVGTMTELLIASKSGAPGMQARILL